MREILIKKCDRNGVWERSSTKRVVGIEKASRDYAAGGHVGICGLEALPRAQMPLGEMKSKGQGSILSHQTKQ